MVGGNVPCIAGVWIFSGITHLGATILDKNVKENGVCLVLF